MLQLKKIFLLKKTKKKENKPMGKIEQTKRLRSNSLNLKSLRGGAPVVVLRMFVSVLILALAVTTMLFIIDRHGSYHLETVYCRTQRRLFHRTVRNKIHA